MAAPDVDLVLQLDQTAAGRRQFNCCGIFCIMGSLWLCPGTPVLQCIVDGLLRQYCISRSICIYTGLELLLWGRYRILMAMTCFCCRCSKCCMTGSVTPWCHLTLCRKKRKRHPLPCGNYHYHGNKTHWYIELYGGEAGSCSQPLCGLL